MKRKKRDSILTEEEKWWDYLARIWVKQILETKQKNKEVIEEEKDVIKRKENEALRLELIEWELLENLR